MASHGDPPGAQSFSAWAFSAVQKLRKAVGLSALFAAAIGIKTLHPQLWFALSEVDLKKKIADQLSDRQILAVIQAVACFVLALLTPRPSTDRLSPRRGRPLGPDEIGTSLKACKRIHLFVVAAFFFW